MPKIPPKDRPGNEDARDPSLDGLVLRLVRRGESERERERYRKRKRSNAGLSIERGIARTKEEKKLQARINSDPELAERIYGWSAQDQAYERMVTELRRFVNHEPPGGSVSRLRTQQVRTLYEALTGLPIEREWERQLQFECAAVLKFRAAKPKRTQSSQRQTEAGAQTSGYTVLRRLKETCISVPEKLTAAKIERALSGATLGRGGAGKRNIETAIRELIQTVSAS